MFVLWQVKLIWNEVEVLQPLDQPSDARGNIRFRTNARSVRKLFSRRHCVLEALLFATGEQVACR